jgi:predicted ArsR family transcriptional regulator
MTIDRYPESAGYRDQTTSRENAERIEETGRAATLRAKVLAFFENGGEATADEVADILNQPYRAVQPRLSELRNKGLIEPTGERRMGSGGGTAHVWRKTRATPDPNPRPSFFD